MKKNIYSGFASGLYEDNTFERFMDQLEGTDSVLKQRVKISGRSYRFLVYHISPQNVTLGYKGWENSGRDDAIIWLFGDEKDIGEIERLVLKAAEES